MAWTLETISIRQAAGRAGGSRRRDDLEALATHPSPRIRAIVAANPACPALVAATLLSDDARRVRHAASRHPSVPVQRLVEEFPVTGSPDLDAHTIALRIDEIDDPDVLASSDHEELRMLAATTPGLSARSRRRLLRDRELQRLLVASQRLSAANLVRVLAGRPLVETMEALGSTAHPTRFLTFVLTVNSMRTRYRPAVREFVDNDACRGSARWLIVRSRQWDVRVRAAGRGGVSRRWLRRSLERGPDSVRVAITRSPHTPVDLAAGGRLRPMVALALLERPDAPTERVIALAERRSPWLRGAAFGHPNLPPEEIVRFSNEDKLAPWQLRQLATNPSCPEDTRTRLLTWLALGGAGGGDPLFSPFEGPDSHRNPFSNASVLERARSTGKIGTESPVAAFRAYVASDIRRIDHEPLKVLAADPSAEVRSVAAGFLNPRVLGQLRHDPDWLTRARAEASIEQVLPSMNRRRNTWRIAVVVFFVLFGLGLAQVFLDDDARTRVENSQRFLPVPTITSARFVPDAEDPLAGFVQITGVSIATYRVDGASLCESASAAGGRFAEIRFCDEPGRLDITARSYSGRTDTFALDP